jgi:hypothetical protein
VDFLLHDLAAIVKKMRVKTHDWRSHELWLLDFRFAPKATEFPRRRAMTRCARREKHSYAVARM